MKSVGLFEYKRLQVKCVPTTYKVEEGHLKGTQKVVRGRDYHCPRAQQEIHPGSQNPI